MRFFSILRRWILEKLQSGGLFADFPEELRQGYPKTAAEFIQCFHLRYGTAVHNIKNRRVRQTACFCQFPFCPISFLHQFSDSSSGTQRIASHYHIFFQLGRLRPFFFFRFVVWLDKEISSKLSISQKNEIVKMFFSFF